MEPEEVAGHVAGGQQLASYRPAVAGPTVVPLHEAVDPKSALRFGDRSWRNFHKRARRGCKQAEPSAARQPRPGEVIVIIDIKDLLASVQAIRSPDSRIGLPDDPTPVEIVDPQQLAKCIDDALFAFRDLRGSNYLVSAEVNSYHRAVWIRFVQRAPGVDRNGQVEPELEPAFQALRATAMASHGELHYWGGNNYFDVSFPFLGSIREEFPEVNHLTWDERYSYLLERAAWASLRGMVFRFSNLAESFAAWCVKLGLSRVLIPSVSLCVHPWLFADHSLSVVATDSARSALAALSEPNRWPRLYSRSAFEQWDIAGSACYATQGNPDHFARMPELQDCNVREYLGSRLQFVLSDWADLPSASGSVDAIFATNALPREPYTDQLRVLKEWVRVVRPGGLVFIAQHNFFDSDIAPVLKGAGWVEANVLGGEHSARSEAIEFQLRYSSG
jgi:Methyltransferase domain